MGAGPSAGKGLSVLLIWRVLSVLLPLVLFSAPLVQAASAPAGGAPPLEVTSRKLTIEGGKNLAVFSGDVKVVREDVTILCDELRVHYRSSPRGKEGTSASPLQEGMGEVDRIVATGNVVIRKGAKRLTGDEAVYTAREEKVVVTGNAVMEEGSSVIRGHRAVFFLDRNLGTVEGTETSRVKATLFPDRKK
jgi:lipopolysaccharide export system protein LptA